ncbi:glycoside hydrolase family 3 C-terminal domain-containing protein [Paenibacillus melissococcoides]|uniref:Glycoside hydrolase family 3 C-terminal domain-containing protein n=1 Tax=Paenibacillus melissococcoides TaxID=2912268 RepID=A0ABN8TZY4_9BACL|nr:MULTISPECIES: glycoside hydrolase family 3 C-terminal domain-containing protein [Paenibacillus]MEB9894790.1 glycoside hydrolase family 3 C-terminal domain-containing protein [Bacillus cereus]CAH8244369.1 glycoside hydrolase family 3 C-terminal domain-containing protein [Paenibacillus melissococcoides]CAH8703346.1 glycoside hydrolase family 3 C-terminal domain-containing protein [Paenibacillus melissococcoides]CAH8705726.1 glycoside hydrolase family 3 C-terminal domain-containing protein [Pae
MSKQVKDIIKQMTLEEKASLCSGLNMWQTKAVERLGIPSIVMTDGPHGLRKQANPADMSSKTVPATCFPSGAGLASSWDRQLIEEVGAALGEECQAEDVQILLGPAVNIKRSPLCGRNFEYFSEDPYLSSEMGAHHVRGVQGQGVGTSVKHFAANNQETLRNSINAVVDDRSLHEIYLRSFEGPIMDGKAWTVMCAYNQVNGEFCSENSRLLTDVLKEKWKHEGFVMTDWGAINERVKGLKAGLELEMPYAGPEHDRMIADAVRAGELDEGVLDQAVERLLTVIFQAHDHKKAGLTYDKEAHHALARRAAAECMVLLKNDGGLLPLDKQQSVTVIGAFASQPRYQGGGSSHIVPTRMDTALEFMNSMAEGEVAFAPGYRLEEDAIDEDLIAEAAELAAGKDVAVIFAGLPDAFESEGVDRSHLDMPASHCVLIEAVAAVQPNTVVVLSNGSPVAMPWLPKVKAVLEGYLGGQATGSAAADVLYGHVNPSGKLAETFPVSLEQTPAYLNFPGGKKEVFYGEGIFVGYRYYEAKKETPLFPFGHGLSYTTFAYEQIRIDKPSMKDTETATVAVTVRNTGSRAGKEVVQLYVKHAGSSVVRPVKELKGFAKISLEPGEAAEVSFTLDKHSFAYFNTDIHDWFAESGTYEILAGPSSADTPLTAAIDVHSTAIPFTKVTRSTRFHELLAIPATAELAEQAMNDSMESLKQMGAMFAESMDDNGLAQLFEAVVQWKKYDGLRSLAGMMGSGMTEAELEKLIERLNDALGLN